MKTCREYYYWWAVICLGICQVFFQVCMLMDSSDSSVCICLDCLGFFTHASEQYWLIYLNSSDSSVCIYMDYLGFSARMLVNSDLYWWILICYVYPYLPFFIRKLELSYCSWSLHRVSGRYSHMLVNSDLSCWWIVICLDFLDILQITNWRDIVSIEMPSCSVWNLH